MEPELDKLDTVAKRIKHVRGRITQEEFAQSMGVHRSSIARYEKGLGKPNTDFLDALHNHYDVNPLWLVSGKGPIKEPLPDKEVRRGIAERLKKIIGSQSSMKFAMDNGIDPLIMIGSIKGWISPNAENLLRIKRASGVSLDWLVDGKKNQKVCQVDSARIEDIYLAFRNTLNRLNRKLTPGQEAQIYTTLYEIYADNDKEIEISTIERMVSMAIQGEEKK
jgi:transcriptional regulator with XRE-family HTH domain